MYDNFFLKTADNRKRSDVHVESSLGNRVGIGKTWEDTSHLDRPELGGHECDLLALTGTDERKEGTDGPDGVLSVEPELISELIEVTTRSGT